MSQFLIGSKKKKDRLELFHQNFDLKHEQKIITPQGIEFVSGEFSPVVSWEIKEPDGKVVASNIKKADSFLANMIKLLSCQMDYDYMRDARVIDQNYVNAIRMTDTAGLTFVPCCAVRNFMSDAPVNISTYGIQPGRGNTLVAFDDFQLEDRILHGAVPDHLMYSAMTYGFPTSDGVTSQFRLTRVFANNSGGAVVVNEAGLVIWVMRYATPTTFSGTTDSCYAMVLRDILPGAPVNVPNGLTLTINYQPQCVV